MLPLHIEFVRIMHEADDQNWGPTYPELDRLLAILSVSEVIVDDVWDLRLGCQHPANTSWVHYGD